jgi:SAM domain (Sterile alpha motif)
VSGRQAEANRLPSSKNGDTLIRPKGVIHDGQQLTTPSWTLEGWLRSLGLEQYEAAFRENAIDETILPSLTAEDLKDLGVKLVGHRRKLLDAIVALRNDTGPKRCRSRPH